MTTDPAAPAPALLAGSLPRRRLAGRVDRTLDAVVVVLASWTVVYHASLLLGIGSTTALVIEAVLLLTLVGQRLRSRSRRSAPVPHPSPASLQDGLRQQAPRPMVGVTVGSAVLAAAAMALDLPWAVIWVCWLVAGLSGTAAATLGVRANATTTTPGENGEGLFALGCAAVLALFATITLRPNPDDLFYVNLAQRVAETGEFPLRDTIFSDLGYPMANWPPLASYDALAGAIAHLLGLQAGDVVYVVVPPVATALAVLALWRLLRAWRVNHVVVALAAALVFLLVDGTASYASPGNLFLTRLWQGKVILLCVVVPVLLTYLLRYAERPSRRGVLWLLLGGAAAVACSTTAIFLVPVIALAGCAPLLARRAFGPAATGFAALAAYPLGAGLVTLALGGRSADDFGERRLYRFDPAWFGHEVFLTGLLAFVAVLAVLVGCLLVPHPAARLTTAVLTVSVGVVLVPGVTRLTYDFIGLGPTLWRLTWGCTVAALVGVLAAYLWSRATPRIARVGAAVAAALLVVTGAPIWASDTNTGFAMPPHWQRGDDGRAMAAWAIETAGPGGLVLAPDGLAVTVAVTTTEVKTVAPRDYYLSYLRDEPGFQYDDRLLLVNFANDVSGRNENIGPALRELDVDVACVYGDDVRGVALLEASGYRFLRTDDVYRCATS